MRALSRECERGSRQARQLSLQSSNRLIIGWSMARTIQWAVAGRASALRRIDQSRSSKAPMTSRRTVFWKHAILWALASAAVVTFSVNSHAECTPGWSKMSNGACMPPGAIECHGQYCPRGSSCGSDGLCTGARTGPLCGVGHTGRCLTGNLCSPKDQCYDPRLTYVCGDLFCSKNRNYPADHACSRCQSARSVISTAGSPASKTSIGSPVLISVGTTPAETERLLEAPLHALPQGVYKLDREYDFNVLDAVYYDAGSRQISLVGHCDDRFKGPPIPYLEHLATLLENPSPKFTLNLTPAAPTHSSTGRQHDNRPKSLTRNSMT